MKSANNKSATVESMISKQSGRQFYNIDSCYNGYFYIDSSTTTKKKKIDRLR